MQQSKKIPIFIIVSRDSKRWSPFLLGEESNGNVIAIRASASQETNGEWNLSVPESSITSEFPNGNLRLNDRSCIFTFGRRQKNIWPLAEYQSQS